MFIWCLALALAVTVTVLGYTYLRLDEELRQRAEEMLGRHYSHLQVELGGARFIKERGVQIYDLCITRPQSDGHVETLLEVDEALLTCPTTWEDLLSGEIRIQKVSAKRARLHLVRRKDDTWGIHELWPPPALGDAPPTVEVSDATLVIHAEGEPTSAPLTIQGIDVLITPRVEKNRKSLEPARRTYHISAKSSGSWSRHFQMDGIASPDAGHIEMAADVQGLEITPELIAAVHHVTRGAVPVIRLAGLADAQLKLTRAGHDTNRSLLDCTFSLRDGRLVDDRLPRPITELTVQGHCDTARCIIELLTAKCGTTEIQLACERAGWSSQSPLGLHAKALSLPLDNALYAVLPNALREHWDRYDPAGHVDLDLLLTYDGSRWLPELTVECREVAFTDKQHFPYRLEQSVGAVHFKRTPERPGGELLIDVLGLGQSYPIHVTGSLENILSSQQLEEGAPPEPRTGWIEVSATKVALHDQLLNALKPAVRKVVQELNPQGQFDVRWRGQRDPATGKLDTVLEITLHDATIEYVHFPYPLRDISGQLICHNDVWRFVDLQSQSPSRDATVAVEGSLTPDAQGRRLQLEIRAEDVALDEELRRALSADMQQVWTKLKPQGRIDLAVSVKHVSAQGATARPEIKVTLRPDGDTVSLDPALLSYPYRLEKLAGQFEYAQGEIRMTDVRAQHGRVAISTQGLWRPAGDGSWQLTFYDFNADHLTASRDLLLALPPRLQKSIDGLQPTGTFSLYNSTFTYSRPADASRRASTSWNLNLECQQSDLDAGVRLEDVSGSLRLIGQSNGHEGYTSGELALDSLVWNNVQFTAIRGPIWMDQTPAGSTVYLGRGASNRQQQSGQPPRRLSARVYGGDVVADIEIRNDGIPKLALQADLARANLTQYALERLGGRTDVTGTINGRIQLSNIGTSTDAMTGGGELHLIDANIYRLPQMVALLKVLQIRTPDTTAFNACDTRFSIQGQHLTFQELNLLGDAVSLYGSGESTLMGDNLNLTFKTEMGRRQIPVFSSISSIWGEAQAQFVQLRVAGTVQNPSFYVEPLPGVKRTLEQIDLPPVMANDPRQSESRFPFWPFR